MLGKLISHFNFSPDAFRLISNYLADRTQAVFHDGLLSESANIISGVPQGSVLGPLLFLIFINDLPVSLSFTKHHIFADDVQLYASCSRSDVVGCINRFNDDVSLLLRWAGANGLTVNPCKSQSMLISRQSVDTANLPKIAVGDSLIPYCSKVRNLGLVINSRFTWCDHTSHICSRIYYGLRTLRACQSVTPRCVRRKLVMALLLPIFAYADVVFSTELDYESGRRLTVAFNSCTRYVYGIRKFSRLLTLSRGVLGCTLIDYYNTDIGYLYLLHWYLFCKWSMSRSARTQHLVLPRNSGAGMNSSFFVRDAALWNTLPMTLRCARSLTVFKSLCRIEMDIQ